MKKIFFLTICIFVFVAATAVLANVMPFNLSVDTSSGNTDLTYRLNEPCTSVTITIYGPLPDTTVVRTLTGTTQFGLNTATWDLKNDSSNAVPTGPYGFSVTATDAVGHSAWTKISNDSTSTFTFSYARGGCKVNKNQGSPYFGMIYNSCAYWSPSAALGIVPIYPDGSDPFGVASTGLKGGVAWSTAYSVSPWHTFIGADDKVWITDYAANNTGIWRAETGDLSGTWTQILDTTNRVSSTGFSSGLYGNQIAMWVEGTGTNTVIYTIDQDLPSGYVNNGTDPQLDSVWKYEVGEGPFPWSTPPTIWIDDSTFTSAPQAIAGYGVLADGGNSAGASPIGSQTLAKDTLGRWWVSNYQYNGTSLPTIVVFSPDRQTIVWDSRQIGTGGGTDPLFADCAGFAIDEKRNRVFTSSYYVLNAAASGFTVFPFDPLPVGNLSSVATTIPIASCTPRQLDIDAAGNLYLHDTQNKKLYIYSPPDNANSFTTQGGVTIQNGVAFNVTPPGPVTISKGKTQSFSVAGGIAPFTWSLSTVGVGSLDTTIGDSVVFTADNGGTVDLTVTDSLVPTPESLTVSITVNPTSAPLFKVVEPRKYIRFELFE